jgi:hypothetical protein
MLCIRSGLTEISAAKAQQLPSPPSVPNPTSGENLASFFLLERLMNFGSRA